MAEVIRAHTVGRFQSGAVGDDAYPVSIEADSAFLLGNERPLLVFPASGVTLATDIGYVVAGDTKPVFVPQGMLTFNGGGEQSMPRRPQHGTMPEFRVLFAFSLEDGTPLPEGGVSVSFDAWTNKVRIDPACHCAVAYSNYMTEGRMATYFPKQTQLTPVKLHFGVVAGFRAPSTLVTYQVQLADEFGAADIELYRIISHSVTTPDGAFEKPPNFPTDGIYPGNPFVLDLETFVQVERVHEIGGMTHTGIPFMRTYHVPRLQPYISDEAYTIPTENRISTLGDAFPQDLVYKAKAFIHSRGLGPR